MEGVTCRVTIHQFHSLTYDSKQRTCIICSLHIQFYFPVFLRRGTRNDEDEAVGTHLSSSSILMTRIALR